MDRQYVLSFLRKPEGRQDDIVYDQDVQDIVDAVVKCHKRWRHEYDKIARLFWRGSVKDTAYEIWSFLKKNLPYKIESDRLQTVKSPAAILMYEDVPGGVDCKHYALFTAGVLDALRRQGAPLTWWFRFAGYDVNDESVHHVFVIVKNSRGSEYWIDPVMPSFDYRKKHYYYYLDKKITGMLSEISGIGADGCVPYISQQGGSSPDVAFSVQSCPVTITPGQAANKGFAEWFGGLNTLEKVLLVGLAAGLVYEIVRKKS